MTTTTIAVSMAKNEIDVIEGCIRHMAGEVDAVIVADNGSTDGTREVLDQLAGELPLTVVDDPDPAYLQSAKMSALAGRAGEAGADFVVPFDSDELWISPYGRIADALALAGGNAYPAQLFNHWATAVDPPGDDPFATMCWRDPQPGRLPKVAFRWRRGAVIHQGNHGVDLPGPVSNITGVLQVRHFPYRSADQFCNPPEAPIWMGDLTFRALGDIDVGDFVMGAGRVPNIRTMLSMPTEVVAVHRRTSPLVRVDFQSGRWLRCTPDHLWRQHFYGSGSVVPGVRGESRKDGRGWQDVRVYNGGDGTYLPVKVGRSLSHVITPTQEVHPRDQRLAGWLGGIFDGEGSSDGYSIQLGQSITANPDVYEDICLALKHFGFQYTRKYDRITLTGGRQAYIDFFNITKPRRVGRTVRISPRGKTTRLRDVVEGTLGSRHVEPDRIVSVEPDGQGDVLGLTTTLGNYVAWGFASKNCRKAIQGAAAYAAAGDRVDPGAGAHWRMYGEVVERHGEEALRDHYRRHFWHLVPVDSGLVHDPAPYRRWAG